MERYAQALIVRQLTAFAAPAAGRGSIGLDALEVATVEGSRRIEADRFLLAGGSRPRVPPAIAPPRTGDELKSDASKKMDELEGSRRRDLSAM